MALRTSENPIQEEYEQGFDNPGTLSEKEKGRLGGVYTKHQDDIDERRQDLKNRENNPNSGVEQSDSGQDDIKSQEEAGFKNNFTGKDEPREKGFRAFLKTQKKRGPLGVLIVLIFGGGFAAISFLTPGLLLLHVSETITDKLNMQNASLDIRTNKVLTKKISNQALNGACTQVVSIKCRFNSLNDRQLTKLRDAGITIELSGEQTITGRHKVSKVSFTKNGETIEIKASDLNKIMRENPEVRAAFKSAYSSKLAGFADERAVNILAKLGITRNATFDSTVKNDEERAKKLEEITKKGELSGNTDLYVVGEDGKVRDRAGNEVDSDGNLLGSSDKGPMDAEGAAKFNEEARLRFSELTGGSPDRIKSGTLALEAAKDSLEGGGSIKSKLGSLAITELPNLACSVYAGSKAVALGAKTIRATQMAVFSYQFLKIASQIKAGDAKPEDVAFFATLLTKTVIKETIENGKKVKTTTKSATDSFGYKYVAYNEVGPPSLSATQFLAGGGLGGKLSGYITKVTGYIGGRKNADTVCKVLNNKWVGIASIGLGIASFIGPGWVLRIGKEATEAVVSAALNEIVSTTLPALLEDMVAGVLVDNQTFGEAAGDAIVSGAGSMMSTMAGAGGNAPLHPAQAVAYTNLQRQVIAQYAEEDRLVHSPFDISNSNTFMGKIASQFIPYTSPQSSLVGYASTTASIITRSFASIFTSSVFADSTVADFEQCEDVDYRDLGLATDPFCNPIRGIPTDYLETDPMDVVNYLLNESGAFDEPQIDEKGAVIGKEYKKFMEGCVNREAPLGYTGPTFDDDDGSQCFIEDDNTEEMKKRAYFYIYQIDSRVLDGMENGYAFGSGSSSSGTGQRSSGGAGIAAMFDNKIPGITQEFGPTDFSKNNPMYDYQADYGIPATEFGHTGVDYGVDLDTKLYSPVNGKVITAGGTCYFRSTDRITSDTSCDSGARSNPGTGELKIQLSDGTEVILGHMHKIDVKVGDNVTVGQYVGLSGQENGPHVHLEYRTPDSKTISKLRIVDPRKYL